MISVVIPAYNAAAFIGDTIDSALRQTLAPLEVIVIDDGSRDDTAAVAERHGARVIRQANGGVTVARNTGIAASKGEWIALLDHDDVWEPQKLARQANAIALHPAASCVATDFVRQRGSVVADTPCLSEPEYRFSELTTVLLDETTLFCPRAAEEVLSAGWFLFPSALLIRRELLIAVGMFRPQLQLCEDVDLCLRVLKHTPLLVVREPLWRWREHDSNNSRNAIGIQEGWLTLSAIVRAEPAAYPEGTYERMLPTLRTMRRSLVAEYSSRGDFRSARRVSRLARGAGLTPTDAALAVVVELPPPIWAWLRRARSALRAFSLVP